MAARDVSFRCIGTVHRDELSNEVIDKTLDCLAAAPVEAVLGITHYTASFAAYRPNLSAYQLRQSRGFTFGLA
jgi:hypothetical protein